MNRLTKTLHLSSILCARHSLIVSSTGSRYRDTSRLYLVIFEDIFLIKFSCAIIRYSSHFEVYSFFIIYLLYIFLLPLFVVFNFILINSIAFGKIADGFLVMILNKYLHVYYILN